MKGFRERNFTWGKNQMKKIEFFPHSKKYKSKDGIFSSHYKY